MSAIAGDDCNLSILANDEATLIGLKRRIFDMVGAPKTNDVPFLHRALERTQHEINSRTFGGMFYCFP